MGMRTPAAIGDRCGEGITRRNEEIDWMLNAIAGAIATGKLPPDDAFAWARIAAHEVAWDTELMASAAD